MDDTGQAKIITGKSCSRAAVPEPGNIPETPEGLSQKASMEAAGLELISPAAKQLQQRQKSKKRYWLVAIIAFFILGVVSGTVWSAITNGDSEYKNAGNDKEIEKEPVSENVIVELSLDNALVQRLYRSFDAVAGGVYDPTIFYVNRDAMSGNPSKDLMSWIALKTIPANACRGAQWGDYSYSERCYDGDKIIAKVSEIFGKKIDLTDGDTAGGDNCMRWVYSIKNHEFYPDTRGCGGQCLPVMERALYKAQRDNNHIYLYEVAVVSTCEGFLKVAVPNDDGEFWSYDTVDLGIIQAESLSEHKDILDKFKWTFSKNADGDYIYTSLERL